MPQLPSTQDFLDKVRPFFEAERAHLEIFKSKDEVQFIAPFSERFGINPPNIVCVHKSAAKGDVASILHEYGHTLFGGYDNRPLRNAPLRCGGHILLEEHLWFVWEYLLASKLDVVPSWSWSTHTYVVSEEGDEWGKMDSPARKNILCSMYAMAREILPVRREIEKLGEPLERSFPLV